MMNTAHPGRDELRRLPHAARIAFACRCARRVRPVISSAWPTIPLEYITSVDEALEGVEGVADGRLESMGNAEELEQLVYAATSRTNRNKYPNLGIANYEKANASLLAVLYALQSVTHDDSVSFAANAVNSAYFSSPILSDAVGRAIWLDFELLLKLSEFGNWNDATPVSQKVFGQMWPEGVPEGWPEGYEEARLGTTTYQLEISGPDGEDAEVVRERSLRLLRLMDRYVRASGGAGVRLIDDADVEERQPCNDLLPAGGGA